MNYSNKVACPLFDSSEIGFKAPTHDDNSTRGVFHCTRHTLELLEMATCLAKPTKFLNISCDPNIWSSLHNGTPLDGAKNITLLHTLPSMNESTLSSIEEEDSTYNESDELPPTSPESLEIAIYPAKTRHHIPVEGLFHVPAGSRFFVVKSFSAQDVEASLKYNIWTSTNLGNKRLNKAYEEKKDASVFLFFSVNGSMKFSGVAKMEDKVDFSSTSNVWAEESRWTSVFPVSWLVVKDVPNRKLKHLLIPKNENKPVTNSRDTQEVPLDVALEMLEIFLE